jgi:hypothetical protein
MRRELAPAGHRIAASGGYNGQGPASSSRWREQGYGAVAILSWGAIGSLEVPTAHPGGVQLPGAPLSFKIAGIYP